MTQRALERRKLLGLHESYYMTLTSIVEGVVFGCLVFAVSANYSSFDVASWLIVITTFLTIVLTWHEYVMGVATFDWVPRFRDSMIPFLIAAAQICACTTIPMDPGAWYLAMAFFCFFVFLAFRNMFDSAREEPVNEAIMKRLGYWVPVSQYMPLVCAVLFVAFAFVGWAVHDAFLPAISLAFFLVFLWRVGKYWAIVTEFALEHEEDAP
jgi:hypothetical protein